MENFMVLNETINNPKRAFDIAAFPETAMLPPDFNSPEESPVDDDLGLALMPLGNGLSPGAQNEDLPFIFFDDDDVDEDDMSEDESFDDMDDDFDDDFDDDEDFDEEEDDYDDEDDDFDYEEDVDYDDFDE
jgi:hypothetical protein